MANITLSSLHGLDFTAMAKRVHEANAKWWHDLRTGERLQREIDELIMLMVSENAEAMEGERKSKPGKPKMDDKLPHRPMAEVEMADVFIRGLDLAAGYEIAINPYAAPVTLYENRAKSLLQIVRELINLSDAFEDFDLQESLLDLAGDDKVSVHWALARASIEHYLSAVLVSCFAYCEKFEYDLMGAYEEKMAFNAVRPDHKVENRLADGGKEF